MKSNYRSIYLCIVLLFCCPGLNAGIKPHQDSSKENLIKALNYAAPLQVWPQSPLTITDGANSPANSKRISAKDPRLNYSNIRSYADGPIAGYVKGVSADLGNTSRANIRANICSVDFNFTGTQFSFLLYDIDPNLKQGNIYIELDGKLTSADGFVASSDAASKAHTINVNFNSAVNKQHVKLIFSGFWAFGGLLVNQNSNVSAYITDNKSKVIVFGDSYVAGTGANNQFVNFYAYNLGKLLGWNNTIISGVGGTGYLNPGRNRKTFRQRINDITSANPDAVIISGGLNDLKYASAEDVKTEALIFYKEIRKALPNCKIIVIGPFYPHAGKYPITYRDAIHSAATAVPGVSFIDPTDYQYGTMLAADGVHPNPDGHKYLANKVAAAIKKVILTE